MCWKSSYNHQSWAVHLGNSTFMEDIWKQSFILSFVLGKINNNFYMYVVFILLVTETNSKNLRNQNITISRITFRWGKKG
jgi:hypothetical protein